ncbi:hypothetical protein KP509_21G030600 [Ceratopteris richardii]|uniref:Uncharacterized protein n=1 Tax=Ceratopteris richardii TaxID=49495 RepID=A0A8T2S8Y2_CERRI|nr:hypothetical protein KP509_21G030600 [Ceratopteris richardii]
MYTVKPCDLISGVDSCSPATQSPPPCFLFFFFEQSKKFNIRARKKRYNRGDQLPNTVINKLPDGQPFGGVHSHQMVFPTIGAQSLNYRGEVSASREGVINRLFTNLQNVLDASVTDVEKIFCSTGEYLLVSVLPNMPHDMGSEHLP